MAATVVLALYVVQHRRAAVVVAPSRAADPTWVVAPHLPGNDLPPVGRSLFDYVVTDDTDGKRSYRIPFPLPALLQRIEQRGGCRHRSDALSSCLKTVLIPLGRSLQRTVASPDFFAYPRVIVAFDGEPAANERGTFPLLKDRLYIGYQEYAGIIEVISYNEAAGRFEFQLVKNYRAGATPSVFYANRSICTACHQNQAPIFSRPLWQETNANPAIAAQLKAQHKDFYGINFKRGVDIPNAIDDAADRANLFSATQTLWRRGCQATAAARGIRCRAALLDAALQYRLSHENEIDMISTPWREQLLPVLKDNLQQEWKNGLAISDPDIPNRDPLQRLYEDAPLPVGMPLAHVPAKFDPLRRRAPLEVWRGSEIDFARRATIGLAEFIARADVERLRPRSKAEISAAVLALADATEQGTTDALSDKPFRRAAVIPVLLAQLGAVQDKARNPDDDHLPRAQLDDIASEPGATVGFEQSSADVQRFFPYCGACHNTHENTPPNFLYGDAQTIKANLERCADRIYFRLRMWQLADAERPKTPMPPRVMLDRLNVEPARWAASNDVAAMLDYVAGLLRAQGRDAPSPDQLAVKEYETLRPCFGGVQQ